MARPVLILIAEIGGILGIEAELSFPYWADLTHRSLLTLRSYRAGYGERLDSRHVALTDDEAAAVMALPPAAVLLRYARLAGALRPGVTVYTEEVLDHA